MRLGRPSPEREREIKSTVLHLVGSEPSGLTFKRLVEEAAKQGISKPTLWRHLNKFVRLGLVLHEDKHYRTNMAARLPANRIPPIEIEMMIFPKEKHGPSTLAGGMYGYGRQYPRSAEVWMLKGRNGAPGLADNLYISLYVCLQQVLLSYFVLLAMMRDAPDLATARDLANILMDSDVTWPLMMFARDMWEHRDVASLKALDGKNLNFRIHTKPRKRQKGEIQVRFHGPDRGQVPADHA